MPDEIARELSLLIKEEFKEQTSEMTAEKCFEVFVEKIVEKEGKYKIISLDFENENVFLKVSNGQKIFELNSASTGHLEAFVTALKSGGINGFEVFDYTEASTSEGVGSQAISFVLLRMSNGEKIWGVGLSPDIVKAPCLAVISALNRV